MQMTVKMFDLSQSEGFYSGFLNLKKILIYETDIACYLKCLYLILWQDLFSI